MWRSLWRPSDRFSLPYFQCMVDELRGVKVVNNFNRDEVIDILQSIVEIVTYGDRHDPMIFECFMEHQLMAEFLRILKISKNSRIEAPLLQYLSIMIQNLHSEQAIYYCFSNEYINNIITHPFDFDGGDLAHYYVSFLRAISGKVNRDTLCLLVKVQEDKVISFPLYREALKFAHNGEKMIQTAIRSLTLNIHNVSDDMVCQFLITPPISEYFSELVVSLREQCLHLDAAVQAMMNNCINEKKCKLASIIDKFLDDLYYIKDLLCVGESPLSNLVTRKFLGLLVVPIMIPLMQSDNNKAVGMSIITSMYVLCRLVQVVDKKDMVNSVATLILYPHVATTGDAVEADTSLSSDEADSSSDQMNKIEEILSYNLESEEPNQNHIRHNADQISSDHYFGGQPWNGIQRERTGVISRLLSENEDQLLASLMLLLVLAESKELDHSLLSVIGFPQTKPEVGDASSLKLLERSIFMRFMPQILNSLLKVLGSTPASPVLLQWHAGYFLQKLLVSQKAVLSHHELHIFNIRIQLNASFHQSREHLLSELSGYWFDYIPDTFKKEWRNCKEALEESSPNKDPFFILELASMKHLAQGIDLDAWQGMVDVVKIFVLHLHLRAYILQGRPPDDPVINLQSKSVASPRKTHNSDASSASFGSEVPLGSGIPCKIAFSKVGVREIYLIPVARGICGKLLLLERHAFHSRCGIVIAMAPLAGLSPKIDESHPTWLHLRIREFNPKHAGRRIPINSSNQGADGRWILGFPDADACKAAHLLINEETRKQRSSVESVLAPFLYDNYIGNVSESQGQ